MLFVLNVNANFHFMKKNNEPSFLQQLLKDKQLLVSRPADMDYQSYKILLKIQNKLIKKALQ